MKHGKRYEEAAKLVDSSKMYEPKEALELVEKFPKTKFDETVELHVKLGVDSKHADQQVRGVMVLPNGTGKSKKVFPSFIVVLPPVSFITTADRPADQQRFSCTVCYEIILIRFQLRPYHAPDQHTLKILNLCCQCVSLVLQGPGCIFAQRPLDMLKPFKESRFICGLEKN